jgi:hypothetical protein
LGKPSFRGYPSECSGLDRNWSEKKICNNYKKDCTIHRGEFGHLLPNFKKSLRGSCLGLSGDDVYSSSKRVFFSDV